MCQISRIRSFAQLCLRTEGRDSQLFQKTFDSLSALANATKYKRVNEIWKGSSWVNNEFVEWVKAIDQFRLIQKWINVPNKNSLVITHDSYSNLLDGQQLIGLIRLWSDRLFVSLSAFDIFFKKKDSDVFSCLITSTRYNVITCKVSSPSKKLT